MGAEIISGDLRDPSMFEEMLQGIKIVISTASAMPYSYVPGENSLEMVDRNGDLAIEGEITEYKTTPVAIQGDQTSALNRLSITVNVRFVNMYEPDKDFEQKFTSFLDYPSDSDYNAVRDELFEGVTEMLTTDIFNKAVINW